MAIEPFVINTDNAGIVSYAFKKTMSVSFAASADIEISYTLPANVKSILITPQSGLNVYVVDDATAAATSIVDATEAGTDGEQFLINGPRLIIINENSTHFHLKSKGNPGDINIELRQ